MKQALLVFFDPLAARWILAARGVFFYKGRTLASTWLLKAVTAS